MLRLSVGACFFGHGVQKLCGCFGGDGPGAAAKGFDSLGLH
ncbi:MAG: hypothetical protein ABSG95_13925 [Solirubrobacteraceae bacterium]